MALKKSDLRRIINNNEATVDERISEILDMLHEEVDIVKDERDDLKDKLAKAVEDAKNLEGQKDGNEWQEKYTQLQADFESYKDTQNKKDARTAKEKAFSELLKDAGLSDEGKAKAMKYTDIDALELSDDGTIATAKDLLESVSSEWSAYAVKTAKKGTDTHGKDGATPKNDGSITAEQFQTMGYKERLALFNDNPELYKSLKGND